MKLAERARGGAGVLYFEPALVEGVTDLTPSDRST